VEETIGVVFDTSAGGGFGTRWNLLSRANPEAKPILYRILANERAAFYHRNVWSMLGYIGDGADVRNLERSLLTDFSGVLTDGEGRVLRAKFDCLGLMCRRGIPEAEVAVDRMLLAEYWREILFKWFDDSVKEKPPFEYFSIASVMRGYALSGNDDVERKIASIRLKASGDPKWTQYIVGMMSPEPMISRAKRVRSAEKEPIPTGDRSSLAELCRKNAALFAKSDKLGEPEQVFIKQVTRDARDAFEKLKSDLVRGEIEGLVPNLLDNGRVIDEEKAKRVAAELSRDLQREQQVFESLAEIETEPGDYKVSRDASYEFPSVGKEGMPIGVTKKEAVTVTFKVTGSAEVGRVFFQRNRGSLTVAGDGTLIVVMKKIDGKWYWNPFGW